MRLRFLPLLALVLGLFLAAAPLAVDPAPAQTGGEVPGGTLGNTGDAEVWRQIRRGAQAQVTIPDREAGVLINSRGENWRSLRNGPVATYGGWLLAGIVAVLIIWFAARGRIRIEAGRSGRMMPRFTGLERAIHWSMAVVFLALAVTGLSILFGRHVIMPVFGREALAAWLAVAKPVHDFLGPVFVVLLVAMVVAFLPGNAIRRYDIDWAKKGGGFLGGGHPHAHRYNFGEKTWFWFLALAGAAVAVSGIVLDFPMLVDGARNTLQNASIVHIIAAVLLVGFSLGHMYLGTVGMEGAFEGMWRGKVDENWAKEHHDLWHEDWVKAGRPDTPVKRPARRAGPEEEPAE